MAWGGKSGTKSLIWRLLQNLGHVEAVTTESSGQIWVGNLNLSGALKGN